MSLNRIAARIAAVQALKGRTFVGDNVLDSQIGAISVDADGNPTTLEPKPFIAVYTDSAAVKGDDISLRSLLPNGETEILFETAYAGPYVGRNPETGEAVIFPDVAGFPDVDENFEFHLDLVIRQIGDALSDPDNDWAEIFRKFIDGDVAIERLRTSSDDKIRLAAHQLKLTAKLWVDPVRGLEMASTHPLQMFFDKADAVDDPTLNAKVDLMREQLIADPHDWQMAVRRYGLGRGEADALGITPVTGAPDIVTVEVITEPAEQA